MQPGTAQRMARRHGSLITLRRPTATEGLFEQVAVRAAARKGTPEEVAGDRHVIEYTVTVAGADLAAWADGVPSAARRDEIVIADVAYRVVGVEPRRLPGGVALYVMTARGPA